jgi:uncharacterized protein
VIDDLRAILRRAPLVMEALRAAREVDVGFFDPADLTPAREAAVEQALRAQAPDLPWEAKNQAAVHLWYPRRFGLEVPPFRSTAEAIATFPEVATCVGVRLLPDDEIRVVSPYGLDDLLGCVCRHNPARVSRALYEERLAAKGWRERWPQLRVIG